jgi:hypothetical protein
MRSIRPLLLGLTLGADLLGCAGTTLFANFGPSYCPQNSAIQANGSAAVTQGPPRYARGASTAFSSASRLVEVPTVSYSPDGGGLTLFFSSAATWSQVIEFMTHGSRSALF